MKVNELMIGDWVYNSVANITFQVYPQFFSQWHNRPEQFEVIIQPIPLTPEILEKNGFQKQAGEIWEYDIFSKDNKFVSMIVWRRDYATPHLSIRSFTLQYGEYSRRDAKYIHQLQHAFHLCGIEKEIEL